MYDVVIIGGGPGGYAAAIRTSQLGGKVALVESDKIGGTCVNRGCIPSKIWLHAAELLNRISSADTFGIRVTVEGLQTDAVVERINGVAGDIRMGMEGLLGYNQVKVFNGRAVLKNPKTVDVDGSVLETKHVIIATGSRLDVPGISGLEERCTTSTQILEMDGVPQSVLIWGAGPIDVEMATFLNRLGSSVTIAMEDRSVLPREDQDSRQRVGQALRAEGVDILARHRLVSVETSGKGCLCTLSGKEDRTLEVEKVLVSTRKPNTAHMGLEQAGIHINDDGGIKVNDRLQTSVSTVYAIGDATGGWMLSHAASTMGIVAAENAMGKTSTFKSDLVPRGIWTSPQVGAVGLTEEEAEAQGYDIKTGDFPYTINALAMAQDQLTGAVKIVSDTKYGRILGVHVVGARATELIGEAVLAMELEATVREFTRSIRVHPTFSETMVEASRDAANWALYLQNR